MYTNTFWFFTKEKEDIFTVDRPTLNECEICQWVNVSYTCRNIFSEICFAHLFNLLFLFIFFDECWVNYIYFYAQWSSIFLP